MHVQKRQEKNCFTEFLLQRPSGRFNDASVNTAGYFVYWSDVQCASIGCITRGWPDSSGCCSSTGCWQKQLALWAAASTGLHGEWSITSTLFPMETDWSFINLLLFLIHCVESTVCFLALKFVCLLVFSQIYFNKPGCLQTGAIEQNLYFFTLYAN